MSNNTLARKRNVIDNVHVNNVVVGIVFIVKAIKSHLEGSNDKQNLTLVISYEMNTRVISSCLICILPKGHPYRLKLIANRK